MWECYAGERGGGEGARDGNVSGGGGFFPRGARDGFMFQGGERVGEIFAGMGEGEGLLRDGVVVVRR